MMETWHQLAVVFCHTLSKQITRTTFTQKLKKSTLYAAFNNLIKSLITSKKVMWKANVLNKVITQEIRQVRPKEKWSTSLINVCELFNQLVVRSSLLRWKRWNWWWSLLSLIKVCLCSQKQFEVLKKCKKQLLGQANKQNFWTAQYEKTHSFRNLTILHFQKNSEPNFA